MRHSAVPFDVLVREMASSRQSSALPFFQVMLVVMEAADAEQHAASLKLGSTTATAIAAELPSKFDLTVTVRSLASGQLECQFEYLPSLFDQHTIETLSARWQLLLQSLFEDNRILYPSRSSACCWTLTAPSCASSTTPPATSARRAAFTMSSWSKPASILTRLRWCWTTSGCPTPSW